MSALLSEADLNDFISPSLACVKPTVINKSKVEEQNKDGEIEVGKEPEELEKVSITLQDCLACVGCITSSEEILLSRQSHSVFLNDWSKLEDNKRELVVSASPQTRLSLANYYGLTLQKFDIIFVNFFKSHFKAKFVVGTQLGRNVTIRQTNNKLMKLKEEGILDEKPRLCSVCPGFVLYCEKTKPGLVPLLLNVKSPQQITGSLLKDYSKKHLSNRLYHLTIMPCFDKKLEASRSDGEEEVDCVITPKEFVTMLDELDLNFKDYDISDTSSTQILYEMSPKSWDPEIHWASNEGSSSGGYAFQYILAMSMKYPETDLVMLQGKNSDVMEYRLIDNIQTPPRVIASSSEIYGFRNIQNLVRKLIGGDMKRRNVKILRKRNTTKNNSNSKPTAIDPHKTDFIEVMACPGGCINGGGLINGEQNSSKRRALIQELNEKYKRELKIIDVLQMGYSDDEPDYEYEFNAVYKDPSETQDIVTVGNTW
ncbi:hypothetical protein TBLA_0B00110 [Henningerozyma blattae CBS 6284]|uniref:Cytosolic Fe-S cluster assembly factor NAR1 n=1 Tax=Henningerozyma blattae (strain ATCC 34711 / CBS 6284 / DSM 70876 / NBRC 10599 / NRRL Y-10934 / UCD 77-7) TaxID=1071380 RepID=I2GXK4_HENB6|nr:hypothetical protein TBLA_0B00110 [Tetrapisispora blattae CBS 6284]CCH58856.1 hypothetical protein TBLA_0B00110 [Tetrapisispora blattae CBS 6284]